MREFHYVTYDDLLNICKTMNKSEEDQSMLIISAPKGTAVEMGEEEDRAESLLRMDASGKGKIRVFSCNVQKGVTEIELGKEKD